MTFKRWFAFVLIAAALVGVVSCGNNKPGTAGYSTITPQQLQSKMDAGAKLVIIDLREPELYKAGHIPGAKNIPFDQFNDRINELKPDDEIVLVCHTGPMGDVSGTLLAQKGYTKVSNLAGGMAAWNGKLEK